MRRRYTKRKPISVGTLQKIAWQVREKLIPGRDAENGDCQPVAEALVDALKRRGYSDAHEVHGNYRGYPHEWVSVGGRSVDPTRDQFRHFVDDEEADDLMDEPVLVWQGKHHDYSTGLFR